MLSTLLFTTLILVSSVALLYMAIINKKTIRYATAPDCNSLEYSNSFYASLASASFILLIASIIFSSLVA